jgi:hypothetical protein
MKIPFGIAPLLLAPLLVAFVRGRDLVETDNTEKLNDDNLGIRCPHCKWRPTKHDTWGCLPGCGYSWNTFETRGECPSCGKRWTKTQCTRCGQWSDHDAWYEEKPQE